MLRIADLSAGYGFGSVIHDINLEVRAGEVVGILGRNGSGKSTLMRVVIGLLPPMRGALDLGGQSLLGFPAHQIARLGVAYVPQGRGIFPKLTVEENLLLGTRPAGDRRPRIPDEVFAYFPFLKTRLYQDGGTLSGGEQQMLALGRALCGRPRLLLMDEPSDGVQPTVVQQLCDLIPRISRSTGCAIVLVEQNVDLALAVSHRCAVMEKGTIAYKGTYKGTAEEFTDEAVLKKYLAI